MSYALDLFQEALKNPGAAIAILGLLVVVEAFVIIRQYRDGKSRQARDDRRDDKLLTLVEKFHDHLVRDQRRRP